MSKDPLRTLLLNWGVILSPSPAPGDIFCWHNGGGVPLALAGKDRDAAQHLTMHETAPIAKDYPAQMSIAPKFGSPVLGYTLGRNSNLAPWRLLP